MGAPTRRAYIDHAEFTMGVILTISSVPPSWKEIGTVSPGMVIVPHSTVSVVVTCTVVIDVPELRNDASIL